MYGHTAYHMSTNYQILYSTFKWLLEAFFPFFFKSTLALMWCANWKGTSNLGYQTHAVKKRLQYYLPRCSGLKV